MRWWAALVIAACSGDGNRSTEPRGEVDASGVGGSDADASASAFPSACTGCSPGQVCQAGAHRCVDVGQDDCSARALPSGVWTSFRDFNDLLQGNPVGPVFDETSHGQVTAVDGDGLTLALDRWGERSLALVRVDAGLLFHPGDAIDLRLCADRDRYAIFNEDWLAEVTSPTVTLAVTGDVYGHHSRCLPTGVTALAAGPTTCAVTPTADRFTNYLAVPADATFIDGSSLRAWAGEQVTSSARTLDVRASMLYIDDVPSADGPSSSLEFVLVTTSD